jgi:hypothetical protein
MNKKNITLNLRSGNSFLLNEKVENLKELNLFSSSLTSKTNEINTIINKKLVSPINTSNKNLSSNFNSNSLNLTEILLPNNDSSKSLISNSTINIDNKAKHINLGNKNLSLNLVKTILKNLNIGSEGNLNNITKNVKKSINLNNQSKIRHYLNQLTNYQFKLFNSNYNYYTFNKSNKYLFAMKKATDFLKLAFYSKGCLISKPYFNLVYTNHLTKNSFNSNFTANEAKIVINLFYYVKINTLHNNAISLDVKTDIKKNTGLLTENFETKFSYLTDYLTKLFGTQVELNLVRLYQPYQDSNILVQFLNSESYNNKFIKIASRLFKNINIYSLNKSSLSATQTDNNTVSYPTGISGVNIKLAGRPLNERIIPRLTVKRAQRGSFNRLNAKLIEKSMFTDKTRKGAFSFTVTLSQVFR